MKPFPSGKYSVIYADPPWSYGDKGFGKRPGDNTVSGSFAPESGRYETLHIEEIKRLPVSDIANKDCVLLLWATSPLIPEALDVIKAWGFRFKTVAFCWSKTTSNGKDVANLGQWTLGNIELCLLATKGSPKRASRCIRQLVKAERGKHSSKPLEVKSRIDLLFGDVQKIELFARSTTNGWDHWGNEVSNA